MTKPTPQEETERIGTNAAMRGYIDMASQCAGCKHIKAVCEDVTITLRKDFGGYYDPLFRVGVVACNKFEAETMSLEDLKP